MGRSWCLPALVVATPHWAGHVHGQAHMAACQDLRRVYGNPADTGAGPSACVRGRWRRRGTHPTRQSSGGSAEAGPGDPSVNPHYTSHLHGKRPTRSWRARRARRPRRRRRPTGASPGTRRTTRNCSAAGTAWSSSWGSWPASTGSRCSAGVGVHVEPVGHGRRVGRVRGLCGGVRQRQRGECCYTDDNCPARDDSGGGSTRSWGGQAEAVCDHDPPATLPPPSHDVLAAPARPSARTVSTDGLTEAVRRRAATPTMNEGEDSTPRRCRGVDPHACLVRLTGTVHGVELSGRCSRRIGCSVILMVSPGCTAVTVPSSRCTKARPGSGVVMAVPESVQRTTAS